MTLESAFCTAAGSSPGSTRQLTFAVARCGNAFGACPALAIVATQVVRNIAL